MRIRTIKPDFWSHELLCQCSEFTRLLAIALLNWADDEGYFMANPVVLRGNLFPFVDDSKMIPRSLQDLSSVGWIELAEDSHGRAIGRVVNFLKHQRVDKGKRSIIKDLWQFQDASTTIPRSIQDASKEEGKGKEGKRKGKELSVVVEPPFQSPEFWSAWEEWVKHRNEKKKPLTASSVKQQFSEMKTMGEARSIAMIRHSIKNGWQGLFENKDSAVTPIRKPLTSDQFSI